MGAGSHGHWASPHGVGIDGCRAGWLVAEWDDADQWEFQLVSRIEAIFPIQDRAVILVDMPIGLPCQDRPTRSCDGLGRAILGKGATSRIFSPPCREALDAPDYPTANRVNRAAIGKGLSKQSWNIVPRIREVDTLLRDGPIDAQRLAEAHPEVVFALLDGGAALPPKKTLAGQVERLRVLHRYSPSIKTVFQQLRGRWPLGQVQPDDLLDAAVLALAARLPLGDLPEPPERDSAGLPMRLRIPRAHLRPDPERDGP